MRRVIGLGRRTAGDDGVGLAILDRLRARAQAGVELVEVAEPCALIPQLACAGPVVIVDAVVTGGAAGELVVLDAAALPHHLRSVSTHGLGLAQALAIARVAVEPAASITVVGVTVAPLIAREHGLSAEVAAAVPRAALVVLQRLGCGA